ncbi:hypothetical protein HYDPIDRAFT_37538 [Hydnomerulius pinastri MD-312]|nr:hypothetical protein HYDPIDRAFT_37538 [Hydnomerulius pinastri MD-312]
MGIIKEYVDRAVQTINDTPSPPRVDTAIVLVATGATRPQRIQGTHYARDSEDRASLSPPYLSQTESAYSHSVPPDSPISPIYAPLISRRLPKCKQVLHGRHPLGEMANRRIVSMPENKEETPATRYNDGTRVVSMPDRIKPILDSSAELFASPSAGTGDSFGSYTGRRERILVFHTPSDVPQTPSPPSSPDSLLIIGSGAHFPDGFLRRKYSPELPPEEDEDWVAWANSPPRPIPALHGPLSLPYARCPSGAEGTIIEEPGNVSRMIWGLGPDDQSNNQSRVDGTSTNPDAAQKLASQAPTQVPSRLQKKKVPVPSQTASQSHAPAAANKTFAKSNNFARAYPSQQQSGERKAPFPNQSYRGAETHEDTTYGPPWTEGHSMSSNANCREYIANEITAPVVDDGRILEWQLALLRQALRNSSVNQDAYSAYPDGLEPVIPTTAVPGFSQPYPRIFVEPRASEAIGSVRRQSAVEIAQQYRQQQLYHQALQNQKMQQKNFLPTPPNSSSPQWSSQFSPYHGPSLSPDVAIFPDLPSAFTSQKYRSSADSSQRLRRLVRERQEALNHASNLKMHNRIPTSQTSQFIPDINPNVNLRHNPSSSSTLAKYLQQLQALSPSTLQSPPQPGPPPNVPLPPAPSFQHNSRDLVGQFQGARQSLVAPTPLSPESPQSRPRSVSYQNPRSVPLTRLMQRRLSSVPEEDSPILEISSSSHLRLQTVAERQRSVSAHEAYQQYLEVPVGGATAAQPRTPSPDSMGFRGDYGTPPSVFHHGTSPAKVRLPVIKEQESIGEVQGRGYQGQSRSDNNSHGYKKKYRYKKVRGQVASAPARARAGGLVG